MAPTEILALQHFNNLSLFLKDFNLKIGILTHSQIKTNFLEKISKGKMIKIIENGEVQITVGTHALIQENVQFKNLALVIVDEQHRFGVEQRKTLREKSSQQHQLVPHLLSMTATPIPRSLALTIYGDLDLSILSQPPKDRLKIITKIVSPENREKAYQFIRKQIEQGRQVFVICPLIEPSDKLGVKSVKQEYEKLDKEVFPDLKIGFLHGKLKPQEKEKIMEDLKNNKINILVATSVVEVGIDIPNATVMMIEGAERFGLAQMHQFRGRVGRSKYQSYCFLFTESASQKTDQRLNALVKSENGFELAEYDLKLRGPGELYGLRQSGLPDLKMASLTDVVLIKQCRAAAQGLIDSDPELKNYPLLAEKIVEFQKAIHWE
jgi:ATP-dependent DNA helicase RecG